MKIGDHEKFDEMCGITRVKNEVSGEDFYVVFANPSTFEHEVDELGDVISKGKTRDEALKNAIKFFVKRQKHFEKSFCEDENESLENIHTMLNEVKYKLSKMSLYNSEEVILPMQAWKYQNNNTEIIDDKDVFWNASIRLNQQGKCEEFSP